MLVTPMRPAGPSVKSAKVTHETQSKTNALFVSFTGDVGSLLTELESCRRVSRRQPNIDGEREAGIAECRSEFLCAQLTSSC